MTQPSEPGGEFDEPSVEDMRAVELMHLHLFPDDACGWDQATPIDTILSHQGDRTFGTLNLEEEDDE